MQIPELAFEEEGEEIAPLNHYLPRLLDQSLVPQSRNLQQQQQLHHHHLPLLHLLHLPLPTAKAVVVIVRAAQIDLHRDLHWYQLHLEQCGEEVRQMKEKMIINLLLNEMAICPHHLV